MMSEVKEISPTDRETYSASDLARDLAASFDEEGELVPTEGGGEVKDEHGRPKVQNPESGDEGGDDELPDITDEGQACADENEEGDEPSGDEDPEETSISIDDIPEDQRLEAVNAIIGILNEEQKKSLLEQIGEGISDEVDSLKAEKKSLEEKIAEIEKDSRSRIDKIISPNSFFASVDTEAELDDKEKTIQANLDYYDGLIDSTDEVFEINGKDYSRQEVRGFRNRYRQLEVEAKEHRYRLREVSKYREKFNDAISDVERKHDWYGQKESEKRKKYDSVVSQIDLDHLRYVAPKAASILPEIIAQYVSTDEAPARRIPRIPIKQLKNKPIRIASGGGLTTKQEGDALRELNRKIEQGDASPQDLSRALASYL